MGKPSDADEPTEHEVETDFTMPDDADLRPAEGPGSPGDEESS